MIKKTSPPATKRDLQELEHRIAAKMDGKFEASEKRMDAKMDAKLEEMESRIMSRFDLLMENLAHDFRGANQDKIALHDDQIRECRDRLTRVERHAGLSAA